MSHHRTHHTQTKNSLYRRRKKAIFDEKTHFQPYDFILQNQNEVRRQTGFSFLNGDLGLNAL